MSRFDYAMPVPHRDETIGASLASAQELAKVYKEECILLEEPLTERVVGLIGERGSYLCYSDMLNALLWRYLAEDPPKHSVNQDQIDPQATLQWKRYIAELRPDFRALIDEFNHSKGILYNTQSGRQIRRSGTWFSRSLVYRTVISRTGLEDLQLDTDIRKKLGKQTVASLDVLLDIPPSQIGQPAL